MVAIKIATITAVLSIATSVSATWVHVNRGCIYIDGNKVCAPSARKVDAGKATIEARLDAQHCVKEFTWPKNYGDIYFGADNCMYDSKGQNFNGQCCVV